MYVAFLPPGDSEFDVWFRSFADAFGENWQSWGFTENDWKTLEGCWALWHKAFTTKSYEASASRALAETVIVSIVNQLCSTNGISDSDWEALGIPAKPTVDHSATSSPALYIEQQGNGNSVGWNVITHPVWNTIELQWREGLGDWQPLAQSPTSQTPVVHEGVASTSVQYRGRWVSSSGAFGPWSAIGSFMTKAA